MKRTILLGCLAALAFSIPSAYAASPAQRVVITGQTYTIGVNVANQPTVSVGNGATNPVPVSFSPTNPVPVKDAFVRTPFSLPQIIITVPGGEFFSSRQVVMTVPAGQRAVIETVSMRAGGTVGNHFALEVDTTASGVMTYFYVGPPAYNPPAGDGGTTVRYNFMQPMRLYADPGTDVGILAYRDGTGAGSAGYTIGVSGYLVPVDSPSLDP